jgi:hypothetical protein
VETFVYLLSRVLIALFIVGVIGCLLVIPRTALELFKVLLEPDTDEEMAGHSQRRASSSEDTLSLPVS